MRKSITTLGVLTAKDLSDPNCIFTLLECLDRSHPQMSPRQFDFSEPLRQKFSNESVDQIRRDWRSGFLWKGRQPGGLGHLWFGKPSTRHGAIYVSIDSSSGNALDLKLLTSDLAKKFEADLAYVHTLGEEYLANSDDYKSKWMAINRGLVTFDITRGLPEMPWYLFLGKPYRDCLPKYAKGTHSSLAGIEITEDFLEICLKCVPTDKSEIDAAGQEAKDYLEPNFFKFEDRKAVVPAFRI